MTLQSEPGISPSTTTAGSNPSPIRMLGWSALAIVGGAIMYSLFTIFTGMEESLVGIPVGLAIGQAMYFASGKSGGRKFQVLAVLVAFAAFDLTYAPGMAGVAFKNGFSIPTFGFFLFMMVVSPVIDAQNGFLGQFMVLSGMYLAWVLARAHKAI